VIGAGRGFPGAEAVLDFLERHFGIWPDNGDGTFEVLIVIVAVTAIVLLGMLDPSRARRKAT